MLPSLGFYRFRQLSLGVLSEGLQAITPRKCTKRRIFRPPHDREGTCLPVLDQHLTYGQVLSVAAGVFCLHSLDCEAGEGFAHTRRVIQAQDKPALYSGQLRGQFAEVLPAEDARSIVVLAVPVRRIDVEKSARAIVAADDIAVW